MMVWSMDLVIAKAKEARIAEDAYEAKIALYPYATRSEEEQAAIDDALLSSIKAMQFYRREVLNDPDWHPDRTYPSPMDYRKIPE